MKKRIYLLLICLSVILMLAAVYLVLKSRKVPKMEDTPQYLTQDDSSKVKRFSYLSGGRELAFVYSEGEGWKYENDPALGLNSDLVGTSLKYLWETAIVRKLTGVKESELQGFGLTQPQEVISYTLDDGTEVRIRIGSRNTVVSAYYVCFEGDLSVVYLADRSIENVYRHPLADYLNQS